MAADKKLFVNAGGKKRVIGDAVFVHLDLREICTAGEGCFVNLFDAVRKRKLMNTGTVFESVCTDCVNRGGKNNLCQLSCTGKSIRRNYFGSVIDNNLFNIIVILKCTVQSLYR